MYLLQLILTEAKRKHQDSRHGASRDDKACNRGEQDISHAMAEPDLTKFVTWVDNGCITTEPHHTKRRAKCMGTSPA